MKKFFRRLLYFLPVPILIVVTNYVKDPANLFKGGQYELGVAEYLAEGKNVTNVVNYDERLLQKFFIDKIASCPPGIILGSSRVLLIHANDLSRASFINNGVSGATLEDDIAIFSLYEKKGCFPKTVLLGLDPWLLNDNHKQTRWKSLEKEYYDLSQRLLPNAQKNRSTSFSFEWTKYLELFSLSYFKTSIKYVLKKTETTYAPTQLPCNEKFTRLVDGSVCYGTDVRNASADAVKEKVRSTLNSGPVYSLGDFTELSEKYKNLLSAFVTFMQSKNIKVEFFMAPYHPALYKYFTENHRYDQVFAAEKYFKALAKEKGISVRGSFDPGVNGFDESFFYDGLHCTEEAVRIALDGSKP